MRWAGRDSRLEFADGACFAVELQRFLSVQSQDRSEMEDRVRCGLNMHPQGIVALISGAPHAG